MLLYILEQISANILFLALHIGNYGAFPPPLNAEEEKNCLKLMSEGDEKAREKLIHHNLRLVTHIIKKYYSNYSDQEDLMSIGTLGLIKGINTFDPVKGTRLATYTARCIENAMLTPRNIKS